MHERGWMDPSWYLSLAPAQVIKTHDSRDGEAGNPEKPQISSLSHMWRKITFFIFA